MTNQEVEKFTDQIRESALVVFTVWALQGFSPAAPFFEEIPGEVAPLVSGLGTSIASLTGEPLESISSRRGLELMLLLAACELNFLLPQEVLDRLFANIFGRCIVEALQLGATIQNRGNRFVLVYPDYATEMMPPTGWSMKKSRPLSGPAHM